MDKLRALKLFLSVVEGGSFIAAAKAHSADPSTISKAVASLEQQLQIKLFQRSPRRIQLTTAGSRYAIEAR